MLLLALLLCSGTYAFAYDLYVCQDSITYRLCDNGNAKVYNAVKSIKTANIPEKITYGGKDYTVTSIRYGAFEGCSSLASVVIPSSVTSIEDDAFYNCSSLASVVIPNSVTSIGKYAFSGCSSLLAYRLNSGYTAYVYDVGNSIKTANIPEKITYEGNDYTVTSIRYGAFEGCSSLASVVIPSSVTSIEDDAFYNCSSLASVVIPNSVTSIGKYAFSGCSSLLAYRLNSDYTAYVYDAGDSIKTANIPEKITYEGKDYTITSIGDYAFYGCSSLASVVIPSSVTSIGSNAFLGCSSLYSVTVGSGVQSIAASAFTDFNGYMPEKVIWLGNTPPEGYKNVKGKYNYVSNDSFTVLNNIRVYPFLSSMFEKDGIKYVPVNPSERTCDAIDCAYDSTAANINIGKTVNYKGVELAVKDIRPYTCYGNRYVKSVKVDYGGAIGYGAFYACDSVASVDITATTIGGSAFKGSCAMTEAKITAKIIGESAFENCATKEPAKFEINAGAIGNGAFMGNSAITEAKITAKTIGVSAFENSATKEPAKFEINAGAIGNGAFKGSSAVTEAKITAKTIGAYAFAYSATENPAKFEISADTIGNSAFKGSSAVTEAKITAKTIAASAFENSATNNPAKFEIKADKIGDNAFTGCSKMEDAVLGESLGSVGNSAFKDCASLKGIIIPDSVTGIGGRCFSGCESLAYAKIGAGVSVIPDEAFNNCKSLPEITIPKTVESIGDKVFYGCTSLAGVTIADRETELKLGSNGSNPMFSSCPLKSVYIGGNITYGTTANAGYSPFYRNTSLETVRITDRETEISENEFYGCTSLKSVSMGDGINTIGRYAFSGCSALESFSFGTGLKSVGEEAFSDCTGMKKLVSKTAVPPICGPQALDDINKWECTLYVPQESLDAYKSAAQWKEFFFLETGIKDVPNTSSSATESERYSTDGTRIASPQKGINIIRMSDGTVKKVLVK